jgi:hypothetical protein
MTLTLTPHCLTCSRRSLSSADDPHTKTNLLLQAHLGRLPLPISDYITDTKGVLDNTLRVLQVRRLHRGLGGFVCALATLRAEAENACMHVHWQWLLRYAGLLPPQPPSSPSQQPQSLVDISADAGWLETALAAMALVQSIMQARLAGLGMFDFERCIASMKACTMP